jgi:hypothetical protein
MTTGWNLDVGDEEIATSKSSHHLMPKPGSFSLTDVGWPSPPMFGRSQGLVPCQEERRGGNKMKGRERWGDARTGG